MDKKEYLKKYQEKNREKINAYQREWKKRNQEKVMKYQTKYWNKKNKEVFMSISEIDKEILNNIKMKEEFKKELSELEHGSLAKLTDEQIIYLLNRYEIDLKTLSDKMGYDESTLRKRLKKTYYRSKRLNLWQPLEFKELIEEGNKAVAYVDYYIKLNKLIMERYANREYWEKRNFNCNKEICIKQEITLPKLLNDELEDKAKEMGITKNLLIQISLLEYYKNRDKKSSGLKFREYTPKELVYVHKEKGINELKKLPLLRRVEK